MLLGNIAVACENYVKHKKTLRDYKQSFMFKQAT